MGTEETSHKPQNTCCLAKVQNNHHKKNCGHRQLDANHQLVLWDCKHCSFLGGESTDILQHVYANCVSFNFFTTQCAASKLGDRLKVWLGTRDEGKVWLGTRRQKKKVFRKGKESPTHPINNKHYLVLWEFTTAGPSCPQLLTSLFQRFGLWNAIPQTRTQRPSQCPMNQRCLAVRGSLFKIKGKAEAPNHKRQYNF